jgi:tetratricopeptide (TPR) repeat protein
MIETLHEAVAVAQRAAPGTEEARLTACGLLTDYLAQLRLTDLEDLPGDELVGLLARLDEPLRVLGLREEALDTAKLVLRCLEIKDAREEGCSSAAWNQLGLLLLDHGELDEARGAFNCALARARTDRLHAQSGILANLGGLSLRAGNVDEAEIWAHEAADALAQEGGAEQDLKAPVLIASIAARVAKARADAVRMDEAVGQLAVASKALMRARGPQDPQAFSGVLALLSAEFDAAALSCSVPRMRLAIHALEIVVQRTGAARGAVHVHTFAARLRLIFAELELAGTSAAGGAEPRWPARRQDALKALERLAQDISAALGPDHPLALDARSGLADARDGTAAAEGIREQIERIYTPRTNAKRNYAKAAALQREKHSVRLIAHAGASYFLGPLHRFIAPVTRCLELGVSFKIIISNPWNSLGAFFAVGGDAGDGSPEQVIRSIESSNYYRGTFVSVLQAYEGLRQRFGELIELRLTPMDVPGSALITSDVGFFEPYMTANLEARTQHGLQSFEIEFTTISRYYELSVDLFETQWLRSSTVDQFRAREEDYKRQLRQFIDTHPFNP